MRLFRHELKGELLLFSERGNIYAGLGHALEAAVWQVERGNMGIRLEFFRIVGSERTVGWPA